MAMEFWDSEFRISDPSVNGKTMTIQNVGELPGGRYVVTWTGTGDAGDGGGGGSWGDGIRAAIFSDDGTLVAPPFVVNTTTQREQGDSSLAVLSDGRFVVVWTSNDDGDGGTVTNDNCIRARVFNSDGSPAVYDGSTSDFVVNTIPGNAQWNPQVIALEDGGFFVAFTSVVVEDFFGDHQTQGRHFGAFSAGGSSEFTLNNTVDSSEELSSITRLEDGGFVVSWVDAFPANNFGPGAAGNNNVARIFNADGSPRTAAFLLASTPVENTSSNALGQPNVAALADGGFVAAWTFSEASGNGAGDGSSSSIRARVFNADGSVREVNGSTLDFQVNTTTNLDQRLPNIVGLADGRFMISFWSRDDQHGNAADTLLARIFEPDGTPQAGGDFILNLGPGTSFGATPGSPSDLIQTNNGRVLAIYNNEGTSDIYGRFLDPTPAGATQAGDSGPNVVIGNTGNDSLNGAAGTDRVYGGAGNDLIHGGTDADIVSGGSGNDTLYGDDGNDGITGGSGDDTIRGGTGYDNMRGGTGNDTYYVDNVDDETTESDAGPAGGTDTVYSTISRTLGANLEILRLQGADPLTGNGNELDNLIAGNGANNRLRGYEGNDTLMGGAGADRMEGGNGNDLYDVDNAGDETIETGGNTGGIDTVQSSVSRNLNPSIENLRLTGNGDINGRGNDLSNAMTGNSANNRLEGGLGNDSLNGATGDDTLNGNDGFDTMIGGAGNDTYFVDHSADQTIETIAGAAGGNDLVYSRVDYVMAPNIEVLRLQTAQNLAGTGNELANRIFGNSGANLLAGLAGDDALQGNDGADTLDGGSGNDTLTGGSQADVFRFATSGAGVDRILDFNKNADRFDLGGGSFSALSVAPNGDAVLTHDGGAIRIASPPSLTLAQWNALVLPAPSVADPAPVLGHLSFAVDLGVIHLNHADYAYA